MESFRIIAERKISQAIADGSLSFEQWKNKPLPEDDNCRVPNDLKLAYKMLTLVKKQAPIIFKNAGPACRRLGICPEDQKDCPLYPK